MELVDVFNQDAFSAVSLTEAINLLPYKPSRLGELSIFEKKGIATTTAVFEEKDGVLSLIPAAARGGPASTAARGKRRVRSLSVPHLPLEDTILASDVQDVREFGSTDALQGVTAVVNDKLAELKASHEVTHEFHRAGAIKGIVLDADGSTLYSLFTLFGISQPTANINLPTADECTTDIIALKRLVEDALGATTLSYIRIMCGDGFWDELITAPDIKDAYDRWKDGEFKREDYRFAGFEYPRGVVWENYRGSVGGQTFVASAKARVLPVGVPGLFKEIYAPADFVEAVNTIGKPYYAKQELMKFGRGIELHTQSNPLFVCTRPAVLYELSVG